MIKIYTINFSYPKFNAKSSNHLIRKHNVGTSGKSAIYALIHFGSGKPTNYDQG